VEGPGPEGGDDQSPLLVLISAESSISTMFRENAGALKRPKVVFSH
jgi:hypothetical protein